jgi:hypothetical protein
MAPTFGDLDGDGDKDLLVGDGNGNLHLFKKQPGPADNFVLFQTNYQGIDVGSYASPQLVDVDRDGLIDLLIGERFGKISYYRNTGTAAAPVFTLVTNMFGGVRVVAPYFSTGYSMPCMISENNAYVLFVGSERGYVYRYDNIDNNLSGNFTLTDSMYVSTVEGGSLGVSAVDINNDALLDFALGNYAGGLTLFYGDVNVSTGQQYDEAESSVVVYPNPASEMLTIEMQQPYSPGQRFVLYDITGKIIMQEQLVQQRTSLSVEALPAGVYFCSIVQASGFTINSKLIISR